jgi:hypothetical protein
MALGDGIRRNVAKVSQQESDRLVRAILELDKRKYWDLVSYWDKQDQIHQATHVHGGPAFVPWHRELINRFEALLREVDPDVSLHYWDWTTDPRNSPDGSGGFTNLFTTGPNGFMGSATGRAGAPLDTLDNNNNLTGSRDQTGNPADPPQVIERFVAQRFSIGGRPNVPTDMAILATGNNLPNAQQWPAFRVALEDAHDISHVYIGGTIGNPHRAFEDPFVFILHSNVDRLWAMWQRAPGREWRLDPNQVYGNESSSTGPDGILTTMQPWAGGTGTVPWVAPPAGQRDQRVVKNSRHPSVVYPPAYDTSFDPFLITTFSPWPGYGIPNGVWLVGDFNGDGKNDIVHAVRGTNYVHPWLSRGNGTFDIRTHAAWAGYLIPNGLWLPGDFSGDGKTDIVHAVQETDYVHVWRSLL